ncbi:DUF411 domain-containing protein [Cognatilysobacter terrigena]|uniref:DUF411 domain-containing protein n=1 Tax=Cognatilysobacter terrigena TaxID=2488749 RepID=UPI001FE26664|nr:DUF411 domain-containing protein [Lysobacter terrigena]
MSRLVLMAALALPVLGACTPAPETATDAAPVTPVAAAERTPDVTGPVKTPTSSAIAANTASASGLPIALVHKSPTCGCCTAWVEHLRKAGFTVEVDQREDLEPLKKRLGVPLGKGSCHTAEIGGLIVEGHVPAEDIKRLLANRGSARGLVLPGMPMGSPGMEAPDGRVQRYTVEMINADGGTTPFATHGE